LIRGGIAMNGCRFCALAESCLASPPLANAAQEAARCTKVAKAMGDHRLEVDELLWRLVPRKLSR
jgi:hypothetical protein